MPGSRTSPGRQSACDGALCRVAFCLCHSVGTQDSQSFAARWLAYAYPCQRFAPHLTVRIGA
jgi:hypothetical protein